jgi:L-ectoine synthase
MIVRTVDGIAGTERDVAGEGWRSRRLVLDADGMNFSLHWTEIAAGAELTLWYKNHYEANLVVAGTGEVEDLATGERHPLAPGAMYALEQHDRHVLRAATDLKIACVFWPALTGRETHDADGSYNR